MFHARFRFAVCAVALCSTAALAHEFWIEPANFEPRLGQPVKVVLRVGEQFNGPLVERRPEQIAKFIQVGPDGEQPVRGVDGTEAAGLRRLVKPGLYVLGYRSQRNFIQLDAPKFEAYLADDGLDSVRALRQERGQCALPGREVFSRCAKALLNVGNATGEGFDRVLGFTLELVPEQNPYRLKPGDHLTVRLIYEGKPLAHALVAAWSRAGGGHRVTARSDEDGRATFTLPQGGLWMISAVHMVAAPADTNADWESLWASLTFNVPGAPNPPSARE